MSATLTRTEPEPTAADVRVPDGWEYVSGDFIRKDMGVVSSWIAGKIARRLGPAEDCGRAWVFAEGTSYRCFPLAGDRLRSRRADASVVLRDRLPGGPGSLGEDAHLEFPPDLAVEVISPTDETYDTDRKLLDYETAGVRLIWVVHPVRRSVQVIDRDAGTEVTLREGDTLAGGSVLPGFTLPVADIFPPATPAVEDEGVTA